MRDEIGSSSAASALWYDWQFHDPMCRAAAGVNLDAEMALHGVLLLQRRRDAGDQHGGDVLFRLRRPRLDAVGGDQFDGVGSPPMMPVDGDTSLARIQSQPLRAQLGLGVVGDVFGLGGKADHQFRPLLFVCAMVERMSGFSTSDKARRGFARLLLDLLAAGLRHPPVGDRGGEDRDIHRQRALDRFQHLARAFDMDRLRRRADRACSPARSPASPRRRRARRPRRWRGPACRRSGWRCSAPGRSARGSGPR